MPQDRIVRLFGLITAWTVLLGVLFIASHRFRVADTSRGQLRALARSSPAAETVDGNRARKNASNLLVSTDLTEKKPGRKPKLPTCLIIGFSKCGTLALRGFLSLHPGIVSPLREIRYFTRFYKRGLDWYRSQMPPSSEEQVTLEKTPSYVVSSEALWRIHEYNSSVKLIAIVRDPITRLQSVYAHVFSDNPESPKKPSFREWCGGNARGVRVLHIANYARHVAKVFKLFPKRNVLVLSEEDLEESPLRVLRQAETFLGLKPSFSSKDFIYNEQKGFYCFNTRSSKYPKILRSVVLNKKTGCLGSGKGREHPKIDSKFLKELVDVIQPYNNRLFDLIGKKFHWSNFIDR